MRRWLSRRGPGEASGGHARSIRRTEGADSRELRPLTDRNRAGGLPAWRPFHKPAILGDLQGEWLGALGKRERLARVRIHGMLAVLAVPLRDSGVLVHVLDDLPPAHARVVRAEGDLSHLGRVGDDTHLRAPEVIGPEIL